MRKMVVVMAVVSAFSEASEMTTKRTKQNHKSTDQCLAFQHRRSAVEHKDGFHVVEEKFTDTTKHSDEMRIRQGVAMTITHTFVGLVKPHAHVYTAVQSSSILKSYEE